MIKQPVHPDLASLLPKTEFSRREVIVTTLATGFALSVLPVSAQTITTDTSGLTAGEVQVPVQGGNIPAYRAMPGTGSNFPVVLVVQEIFGVHEHIKDICRRFAKAGYFAIAPELYARQGDVSQLTDFQKIMPIVASVPDAQVMSDLDAAVAYAQSTGSADTSKLGITGFCWGGRIVWLYAAHSPQLKAGVAWYGRLVGDPNPLQPRHPVDVAAELKAPVLGLYAESDNGIPLDTVERMRTAISAAGKNAEIVVYPAAQHGFYADYRPSYKQDAAQDAWQRLLAFFRENGAA